MTAAHYKLTDFRDFLSQMGLMRSSQDQVVTAIRRALKHLDAESLNDLEALRLYRLSMPEATRRIFGYAWTKFQPYMESIGQPLPNLPKLHGTQLVHPLWADLTDLSIHLNVNMISWARWRDLYDGRLAIFGGADASASVEKAARRSFEFITGREPLDIDCLIPRNARAESSMPVWAIETILRTNPTERDTELEKAAFELLQIVTRRNIEAMDLRNLWETIEERLSTTTGRRRIVGLRELEIDLPSTWTQEDQELVLSALGTSTKPTKPISKPTLDISGAVVALRDAMNRATVTS